MGGFGLQVPTVYRMKFLCELIDGRREKWGKRFFFETEIDGLNGLWVIQCLRRYFGFHPGVYSLGFWFIRVEEREDKGGGNGKEKKRSNAMGENILSCEVTEGGAQDRLFLDDEIHSTEETRPIRCVSGIFFALLFLGRRKNERKENFERTR